MLAAIEAIQAELDRLDTGIDVGYSQVDTMVALSTDDEPSGYDPKELLAALQELPDGAGLEATTERICRVSVTPVF